MYAIYIRDDDAPFTDYIFQKRKILETRNRDTLGKLVGKRVAIIRTGRYPEILGTVEITDKEYYKDYELDWLRPKTKIPLGSKYNPKPGTGKWCYFLSNPVRFSKPIKLDWGMRQHMINHGRSYTEFVF